MNSGTSQYGTLAEWLQSDVFIVFVVVAVVLGLVLGVVCWVLLRQRRCTQCVLVLIFLGTVLLLIMATNKYFPVR